MTSYQAEEYLAKLGAGDHDAGFDMALAWLESEGYQFRPGAAPLNPRGQPCCNLSWRRGLMAQVAILHKLATQR